MASKDPRVLAVAGALWLGIAASSGTVSAQQPTPTPTPTPPAVSERVVVSATRLPEEVPEIPASVTVVGGDELRRRGTRTLADALQDVVGLDAGNGSDGGARLPNIGLWGLKEFDALLITLDGVPVGGPFNPNLAMIPIEEIDRIEVVRGPQGTLYGVSAFAGMIQVFTRHSTEGHLGSARVGGFSAFEQGYGDVSLATTTGGGWRLGLDASMARGDGWQDRTDLARDSVRFTTDKIWGDSHLNVGFQWLRDTNFFGSPLPVEGGLVLPGFEADKNYAVGGGRIDHHALNLSGTYETPLSQAVTLSTTLGGSQDQQGIIRSFILSAEGDTAEARGQALEPEEKTAYLDAHIATDWQAGGRHRLVGGVGVTWGETRGQARDFEFELQVTPEPIVPDYADLPTEEERQFEDMRRFIGVYLNDEWTPTPRLTVTAGLRYDSTSEELEIEPLEEEGGGEEEDLEARDKANDSKITGGIAALYRIVEPRAGTLSALNVYGGWRTNFKPAAPNVAEPEGADILDPETTDTWEAGAKTTWFDRSATLNVTYFDMDFQNMVVGILTPDGPRLVNAGEQRFKGVEVELGWTSPWMEGLSFYGGYAYHDARFVEFSFVTPDGELRVVDGKRLELAPRDMWNVKAVWAPASGFGGFVAVRHQNQRPLTRRNTAYTPSFFETDAGISYEQSRFRIAVVGRNLGDSRHYVAESEIGDSQFYVAPPLGVSAELTVRF